MNRLDEVSTKYGMKINIENTKVMKITRGEDKVINIILSGKKIEQVDKFKCLGTNDGGTEMKIKVRIVIAKDAFKKIKEQVTKSSVLH